MLEVIAISADDAVAAQAGGADRLELVTDMAADGLTPPRELFAKVRASVDIPVRVMLRTRHASRRGECCAWGDLDRLRADAEALRGEGADEFVLGFLNADGTADIDAVLALVEVIDGCRWTFHRAIDRAVDRAVLRAQLAGVPGLDTYLTAGSAAGVDYGLDTLTAEASLSGLQGHRQRILAGGGLRPEHLPPLRAAGIDAFHVGGAVRGGDWTAPVAPAAVEAWRGLLDAPVTAG